MHVVVRLATPSQKLTLALRVCVRSYCTRRATTKSLLMPVKKHPMELCKFKSYAVSWCVYRELLRAAPSTWQF